MGIKIYWKDIRMKKFLVIGGNSAISKNLIDMLVNLNSFEIDVIARSNKKTHKLVNYIDCDYNKIENHKDILQSADFLFYSIGITNGTDTEIENINVLLFEKITKLLNLKTKIIFMSSASILYNDNSYSNSKKRSEEILDKLGNDYISLRPSVMYGNYDKNNLVKMMNILKKLPIVPVIAPSYKIQPVFMNDLVHMMLSAVNKDIFTNKAYITSGPEQVGMYNLFKLLAKKCNLKRPLIPIPLKPVQLVVRFLSLFIPAKYILAYQVLNMRSHPPFDSSNAITDFDFKQTKFEQGLFEY